MREVQYIKKNTKLQSAFDLEQNAVFYVKIFIKTFNMLIFKERIAGISAEL